MTVKFYTTQYMLSHMKEPKGRGSWALAPHLPNGKVDENPDSIVWCSYMTLPEAKRHAKEQLPSVKAFEVMP